MFHKNVRHTRMPSECPTRVSHKVSYITSTCVKSSGLVESRLDVAFPLGLDARWQYNWKSIRSTTLFGCCVSIGVGCKMSPSLEDKLWNVSSTPLFGYMGHEYMGRRYIHGCMGLAWHSRQGRKDSRGTRASLTMFPLVIFSTRRS